MSEIKPIQNIWTFSYRSGVENPWISAFFGVLKTLENSYRLPILYDPCFVTYLLTYAAIALHTYYTTLPARIFS